MTEEVEYTDEFSKTVDITRALIKRFQDDMNQALNEAGDEDGVDFADIAVITAGMAVALQRMLEHVARRAGEKDVLDNFVVLFEIALGYWEQMVNVESGIESGEQEATEV